MTMRWLLIILVPSCFALSFAGATALTAAWQQETLIQTTINAIEVTSDRGHIGIILDSTSPPVRCSRFIAHYIVKARAEDTIVPPLGVIIPLAYTFNSPEIPPPPSHYRLELSLPYGIAPGHWIYRSRAYFICRMWPVFLRTKAVEGKSIPFDVPNYQ